ncbi:MAG: type II toxin-antitoxin system PemK/MazF family toxin [archaeon]
MDYSKGDLVIISYPFSNFKESKIRPALIISNNFFNKNTEDFILVPLTSILKKKPFTLLLYPDDMALGNLIKASNIRVDKIFSMKKELVKTKIGIVNKIILKRIENEFMKILK